MSREDTLNMARQVPRNVLDVLRLVAPTVLPSFNDASNPYLVAHEMGVLEDGVFLGNLMLEIYRNDRDALNWLVDETEQVVDGDKLKLAIIALTL